MSRMEFALASNGQAKRVSQAVRESGWAYEMHIRTHGGEAQPECPACKELLLSIRPKEATQ